jgi:hypothetical protein
VMKVPILHNKPVWVLHPEGKYGVPVAYGKTGIHWKCQKAKNPDAADLEDGVQLVHIQHVFFPGVLPMYATKQRHITILEDALKSNFVDDGWVQWNTDFLVEHKA